MRISFFFIAILFFSCEEEKSADRSTFEPKKKNIDTATIITNKADTCDLEKKLVQSGLVELKSVVEDAFTDVRYSSDKNFMKKDLYGDLNRIYVHPALAEKLKKANELLHKNNPDLFLLIFDGVRPKSVQQVMWDEFKMPAWKKGKFLSNPSYGSLHNYGMAVDITLCDSNGIELDMGTPYDDTARLAYPELESYFLANGELKKEQHQNRQLLRQIMYGSGFFGIQSEWWHFNACTRDFAKANYKLIE